MVALLAETMGLEDTIPCYPVAQLSQEQVVADKELFVKSLKTLHEQIGTPFRVPQVCGKDLDLHLLYKQVISAASRHVCHQIVPSL